MLEEPRDTFTLQRPLRAIIVDANHRLTHPDSKRIFSTTVHELKPGDKVTIGRNWEGGLRINDRDVQGRNLISSQHWDLKNVNGTLVLTVHSTPKVSSWLNGEKLSGVEESAVKELKAGATAHTAYDKLGRGTREEEAKIFHLYVHVPTKEQWQAIEKIREKYQDKIPTEKEAEEEQAKLDAFFREMAIRKGILGTKFREVVKEKKGLT